MRLVIGDHAAALVEPADTKALSVDLDRPGLPPARLAELLDGWGVLDGEHVRLDIGFLRAAGRAEVAKAGGDGDAWSAEFDAMLAYAGRHGWVDEAAGTVRAHIRVVGAAAEARP